MKRNHNTTRCAACMLRMFWRILKRVPFICMVRTDSPSQRAADSALYSVMPLWSSGQAVIFHNEEMCLC